MSAARAFFDAIDQAKRNRREAEARNNAIAKAKHALGVKPEDTEMECRECSGTGLVDGPDGPPCEYCEGSGIW